jgi:hypothetical protein
MKNVPAMMSSAIPVDISEALLGLIKYIAAPVCTFLAGLFFPHVQKPLAEYRQTLTDISKKMLCSVPVIYGDSRKTEKSEEAEKHNAELRKFYDDMRSLHARLLSSADSIPRFARPVLQILGLLRPRAQIEEGAKMLIGISNQVMSASKDLPHLTEINKKLGTALDITV